VRAWIFRLRLLNFGLSLKSRIVLGGLLPVVAIAGYSAYAYRAQKRLAFMTHQILETRVVMMQSAEQIKQSLVAYDDGLFRYLETLDTSPWRDSLRLKETAQREIRRLEQLSPSPVLSERLEVLNGEAGQYFADAERLLEFSAESHTPISDIRTKSAAWTRRSHAEHLEFAFLSNEGRARLVRVFALCDEIITVNRLELENAQHEMNDLLVHSRITALLLSLCCLLVITLAAIGLVVSLLYPLQDLMDGVHKLERGELNFEIPSSSHDELGELTTAFNRAARTIREQREAL